MQKIILVILAIFIFWPALAYGQPEVDCLQEGQSVYGPLEGGWSTQQCCEGLRYWSTCGVWGYECFECISESEYQKRQFKQILFDDNGYLLVVAIVVIAGAVVFIRKKKK